MKPADIISIARRSESLKRITRSGWAIAGLNHFRPESIAEHTYGTSALVLLFSIEVSASGELVDTEKALLMSLIHDLAESEISDIPQTAVVAGGESMAHAKKRAEENAISDILASTGKLLDYWREYEAQTSLEARIVRGADTIDMLMHAVTLEEGGASPSLLDPFFQNSRESIDALGITIIRDVYEHLAEVHAKHLARG